MNEARFRGQIVRVDIVVLVTKTEGLTHKAIYLLGWEQKLYLG